MTGREGVIFTFKGALQIALDNYQNPNRLIPQVRMEYVWGGKNRGRAPSDFKRLYWTRLLLQSIEDRNGNRVVYQWFNPSVLQDEDYCLCAPGNYRPFFWNGYYYATRLEKITYNGGSVEIRLNYTDRVDRPDSYDNFLDTRFSFYLTKKLSAIDVTVYPEGTTTPVTVRQYKLVHTPQSGGSLSQIPLFLSEIQELSSGVAANVAARVGFDYSPVAYVYPCTKSYLSRIQNEYGGVVTFTADPQSSGGPACAESDWKPPKVLTRTETDTVTNSSYVYRYGSTSWNAGAKGYERVCVGKPDGSAEEHEFETMWAVSGAGEIDHAAGREKAVSHWTSYSYVPATDNCTYSGPLARQETTWGFDYSDFDVPYQLAVPYYLPSNVAVLQRPRFIRADADSDFRE